MAKKPTTEALQKQIADLKKTNREQKKQLKELTASNNIKVSDIHIKWDPAKGKCTFEDLPVAMMWVDTTLAGLMSGVETMVGTKRFNLSLQSEGRKSVEADWEVMSQYDSFEEAFEVIANIAAVAGWGRWKLISLDRKKKICKFQVQDCWEGRYQKTLDVCWGSGMLAGKMAGYCTKLFNTNCWANQTKFIAKGHKFDEFVVKPSPRLIEKEIDELKLSDDITKADLEFAVHKLQVEVTGRKRMEEKLREIQRSLQRMVNERTEELSLANKKLHKEIEERQKNELRLQSILVAAPMAIGLVHNRYLTWVDDRMLEMLGYTEEELVGQSAKILYPSEEEFLRVGKVKYGQLKHSNVGEVDTIWKKKDGTLIDINLRSSPLDQKDFSVGVTFTALDITERKRIEEELHKTQKLDSIGVLAGGIAHDFNNYLFTMMGNVSLAKMELNKEHPAFDLLTQSEKASIMARGLTQQLLTFSKGGEPVTKVVNIKQLLKDCTKFALSGSNVTSQFSFKRSLHLLEVDKEQISQVIQNIVTNAVHVMPKGGTIRISAENYSVSAYDSLPLGAGEYVKINFSDEGPGIDAEHIEKIFDPYFTTKQMGNGLGLAICYSIIRKHHGVIMVDSKAKTGATFSIFLPASTKTEAEHFEKSGLLYQGSGRVLLMDDDNILLDTGTKMLQKIGFRVDTAKDGKEALKLYKQSIKDGEEYNLLIIDLTIPGSMGGKETMENLLKIKPDIPAIVSSGYSNDPIMSDFKKYGFKGVLPKPYTIETLSKTVFNSLNKKNAKK